MTKDEKRRIYEKSIQTRLKQLGLLKTFIDIGICHGVLVAEMFDSYVNRPPEAVSHARHTCMALLRERGWSYPRIGALFGVDHTSVMHGVRSRVRRLQGAA